MAGLILPLFGKRVPQGTAPKIPVNLGSPHHHAALSQHDVQRQAMQRALAGVGADAGPQLHIERVQRPRGV